MAGNLPEEPQSLNRMTVALDYHPVVFPVIISPFFA